MAVNQISMNNTPMTQGSMMNSTVGDRSVGAENQSIASNQTAATVTPSANANVTAAQAADATDQTPAVDTQPAANVTATPSENVTAVAAGSIKVENHSISGNQVIITEVTSNTPAWVVIRPSLGVTPDTTKTFGYAHIDSVTNNSVAVPIISLNMTSGSTAMLWAVLQKDDGKARAVYEYPGPDLFVRDANGQYVESSFQATVA
jgi:hypothetical protein